MADDQSKPSATVTPLQGVTTLDEKMGFEALRLSYKCADRLALKIAKEVVTALDHRTVAIVGMSVLADLANLEAVRLELARLETAYEGFVLSVNDLERRRSGAIKGLESLTTLSSKVAGLITPPLAAATAATSLLKTGLGIVSLFRQDVEFHGTDTTVDSLTVEIALAGHLRAAKPSKVYVVDLLTLPITKQTDHSLHGRLVRIEKIKADAWRGLAPFVSELAQLDARLAKAVADKDQKRVDELTQEISSLRRDLQPISDPLSSADRQLADLDTQWKEVDSKSGLSGLARLLRAESLREQKPLYLHCAIVASGGHYRLVRNLWRTLFSGDGVSFMGGAIVRWSLLDDDGSVLAGGVKSARASSKEASRIMKYFRELGSLE